MWYPLLSSEPQVAEWLEPPKSMKRLPRNSASLSQDSEPKHLFPISAVFQTLGFPPGKIVRLEGTSFSVT